MERNSFRKDSSLREFSMPSPSMSKVFAVTVSGRVNAFISFTFSSDITINSCFCAVEFCLILITVFI